MNTFLTLAKKIPWWGWVGAAIAVLFLWQSVSGWAATRKLYNMALDNLRHDQSRVIEVLEENEEIYEAEINRLTGELQKVKAAQSVAAEESGRLRRLVREKDAEIDALKKEYANIVIPTDPNALADDFRKRGYKPRTMLPPR